MFEVGHDILECKYILQEYSNFSLEIVQRQASKINKISLSSRLLSFIIVSARYVGGDYHA